LFRKGSDFFTCRFQFIVSLLSLIGTGLAAPIFVAG
jgi:hypothetical protein